MDRWMLVNLFANSGTPPGPVTVAWLLFTALLVLLSIFVLGITLLMLRRWIRRRHSRLTRDKTTLPDPWQESAKRIEPYDKS